MIDQPCSTDPLTALRHLAYEYTMEARAEENDTNLRMYFSGMAAGITESIRVLETFKGNVII
jgi:hypothetical protein